MHSVFLIGGSKREMFSREIYPAILLALALRHLGNQLNTCFQITKSTCYKLSTSTMRIMISIAKPYGIFTKRELNYFKQLFNSHFEVREDELSWYLQLMKQETYQKNISINTSLKTIASCKNIYKKRYSISCFNELATFPSPMTI